MVLQQDGRLDSGLDSVLTDLRRLVPSAATPGQAGRWISSDCCGVLLLLSTVRRMGLWRAVEEPEFMKFGGPRAFSFLLAAVGMKLLGEWDAEGRVDPAVALFAGIFSDVDRTGLKRFLAAEAPVFGDLIHGGDWPEALQNLAAEMSRRFAERVRGFRQASREAVVKQFLRTRGRVLVEKQRLLVVMEVNPWAVALHISGMDEAQDGVEWLGGRRVEFDLEGL
jgi:hypothetical protein